MRPLIGITPDEGTSPERPGRPASPRYELKTAYADAVLAVGGAPLVLPYAAEHDAIDRYLGLLSGLIVTGGAFDISPNEYGQVASDRLGPLKPRRTRFERRLLEQAMARGLPVLGVCGGMQLLNVVCGGTLVQDIGAELPGSLAHEQAHDPREPAHDVSVLSGTRLERIVRAPSIAANTTHHQAVREPGRGLIVSARSSDGVIEAVEGSGRAFTVGVQWHPELLSDPANRAIYGALVEAAA